MTTQYQDLDDEELVPEKEYYLAHSGETGTDQVFLPVYLQGIDNSGAVVFLKDKYGKFIIEMRRRLYKKVQPEDSK